ncbi:MAG: hypothetical protein ACKOB5_09435, partial [Betaproteobacteria bacterium]
NIPVLGVIEASARLALTHSHSVKGHGAHGMGLAAIGPKRGRKVGRLGRGGGHEDSKEGRTTSHGLMRPLP